LCREADLLEIFLWICLVVGVLYGLDLLFLAMEAKGWVYYRKVKRQGSGGSGILEVGSVFDPTAHAAVEARQERAGEEDEDDGDDDARRKTSDRLTG
jgi:hypothetical protein